MRLILIALGGFLLLPAPASGIQQESQDSIPFAETVARLSGTGGYFDTDNLISNETGYLHVVPALLRSGLRGGAYLGVGPDQNFSYIAALRPEVAIVVDLRRDNLLHHLLLKGLMQFSPTRADFLSGLTGRPLSGVDSEGQPLESDLDVATLVSLLGETPVDSAYLGSVRRNLTSIVASFGVPLTQEDLETVARFHDEFVGRGMGLRFTSAGRAPRAYYPTLGALIEAQDLEGVARGYLASEEGYQTVRSLQLRGRIIPVVGDLGSGEALPAVSELLEEMGWSLTAFYTSNVEFYLVRQGTFGRFAASVSEIPARSDAVLIRSVFLSSFWGEHPLAVPGHASVQVLERVSDFSGSFEAGDFRSYADVATLNVFR